MNIDTTFRQLIDKKDQLSLMGKKKLLLALCLYKKKQFKELGIGSDKLMDENEENVSERNVIAKTFDTNADFDSYTNQRRGIEFTPKEIQAISTFTDAKPTEQDRFFIKYESSDDFNNNSTTIIKKLREGEQFCYTAFTKHDSAEQSAGGESNIKDKNKIRIIKTITFINDDDGSDILGDFLRKIDL